MATNLFKPKTESASSAASRDGKLVQVKAGKMFRENTLVKPDTRKGLIYMHKSEDGLLHFCWKDRKQASSAVEDDLIVFPDEAEWLRVEQCKTGRVYVLKFKTSNQRLFFWMQDFSDEGDAKVAERIGKLLKDPSIAAEEEQNGISIMSAFGSIGFSSSLDFLFETIAAESAEQNQLMQILQAQGLLDPLQQAAMQQEQDDATSPANAGSDGPSLSSVLTPDLLEPVLSDPNLREKLFPHLPEGHDKSEEELRSLTRSPIFQQAVESLNAAIESGEHGPLLAELGLDPSVATASGNKVLALLKAIKEKNSSGGAGDQMETQ